MRKPKLGKKTVLFAIVAGLLATGVGFNVGSHHSTARWFGPSGSAFGGGGWGSRT